MRKILFISLALMLAACGVVQPVQQELPTPIIATVLVTVIAPRCGSGMRPVMMQIRLMISETP